MYSLIKPILFKLDPEQAHSLALKSLKMAYQLRLTSLFFNKQFSAPVTSMGLTFANPIGLAAGLDKDADYIDALAALGFGSIEIGTVTPKPQIGNPRPRLFRLREQQAIINRMGFNSKGIDYVVRRLEKTKYRGILGINIGKNKETANENAIEDYLIGFQRLWKFASYITINLSSPNTPGLRDLQHEEYLSALLSTLKQEQAHVFSTHKKYVPLVVKISPDLSPQEIDSVADVLLQRKIDGVIATNTTISREGVQTHRFANEMGGLSGKPLRALSTKTIKQLHERLQNQIPIIAVGGIMDRASAQEKFLAGATLLQVYTGFIYEGPNIINACVNQAALDSR